jgi:hypothetical protein
MLPPIFQRETQEFLPVAVTVNGTAVTSNVEFDIVASGDRPLTFGSAVTLGTAIGVMVENLSAGGYEVFAKVSSSPEIPVLSCGSFIVE